MCLIIFGILIIGCDNVSNDNSKVDTSLNGIWITQIYTSGGNSSGQRSTSINEIELRFNNGNYERSQDGIPLFKGTYTTGSEIIIFTMTHIHGSLIGLDNEWYSRDEYLAIYGYGFLGGLFSTEMMGYFVSGNNLIFTDENGTTIYTRRN